MVTRRFFNFINCTTSHHRMTKLLKPKEGVKYTDLIIGFESENSSEKNVDEYGDEDDDLAAPPVRYFYTS